MASESLILSSSDQQEISIPSLYDLILTLNCDCGFEAFFHNLVNIFETYFDAERISVCLPTDPTDIVNIPWGLKAVWNKRTKLSLSPHQSGRPKEWTSRSNRNPPATTDDEWDTDEEDIRSGTSKTESPRTDSPRIDSPKLDTARDTTTTPPPKHKFSLSKRLSKTWKSRLNQSPPPKGPQISKVPPSVEINPHVLMFDQLRTLEWELDPLIDAQGIIHVLDHDQLVLLQRRYTNNDMGEFYDSEQPTLSPWTRSPAPSPAVREFTENPFFNPTAEMEKAFEDPDAGSEKMPNIPVGAIGFENTYSVIHLLLVVPSSPSDSYQKSAPIGVVSVMSSLIPFPSKLRTLLVRFAPHIATSCLQARAHSTLSSQLETYTRTSSYFYPPQVQYRRGSLTRSLKSPRENSFQNLENLNRFYTSLKEDRLEESMLGNSLEILADNDETNRATTASGFINCSFTNAV